MASPSGWVALGAPSAKCAAQPCHSAWTQNPQISEPSFFYFLFNFSVSCSFYFNTYFYLNHQSHSGGRKDTGTCYLGGGSAARRWCSQCARREYRPRGGRRSCWARGAQSTRAVVDCITWELSPATYSCTWPIGKGSWCSSTVSPRWMYEHMWWVFLHSPVQQQSLGEQKKHSWIFFFPSNQIMLKSFQCFPWPTIFHVW